MTADFRCLSTARRWARVAFALAAFAAAAPVSAQVVISQVYGGNGNTFASDYVELVNRGTSAVTMTNWSVQYSSATGTGLFSANGISTINATLQPGQYHLVRLITTSGPALAPSADTLGSNSTNLSSANGKVILANVNTGLACNGGSTACNPAQLAQIVDLVGYGSANFFETAAAPALTSTTALFRANAGCTDTGNNGSDFTVGTPAPRNSASAFASCGGPVAQPIVPACPASVAVATGAALNTALSASDADSTVNSAVFVSGNVAGMSLAGFSAAPAVGGTATVNLSLANTVAAGTYPVVVRFGNDTAQTADCTISVTVSTPSPYTPIYQIQGSGTTSTELGVRTTQGVVTKVNNNGYFLQDPVGDGNPLTSDGIFVFTSSAPTVSVGQLLQVTGTVVEFDTGFGANPVTLANPVTEFTFVTSTVVLGSGSIAPTPIVFPIAAQGDLERYEGMLVQISTPLVASQNFFQGRYGQVTLGANNRLFKPTQLHRPGTPAAVALADQNARSSILLDDGSSAQNPNPTPYIGADNTLRAGDTLPGGITGVIDYGLATNFTDGLAMFRIHPTLTPAFTRSNVRTAAPAAVGGNVKVASFNVLNFFTTFGDGTNAAGQTGQTCTQGTETPSASLCRGADSLSEFTRQRSKIVEAMAAINADVFGLIEIQNNGNTAAQNLVDALNAKVGAGTYAVVPLPPATGTDAIRQAMVYKPGSLALSGAALSDSNPIHNRPPMAQAFTTVGNGEKFSVVVNHFKSKRCDGATGADADAGDGQGCYNALRLSQAQALLTFVNTIKTSVGDDDVLVIGDLNAYGKEDPIDALVVGGLVDQSARFDANFYSYVFDGEAGALDHALATSTLSAQVSGSTHWHINADEPSIIDYNLEFKQPACPTCGPDYYSATAYRASDHDPVVVGLNLGPSLLAQTITFPNPGSQPAGSTVSLGATATSGLPVSYASLTPAVCTASGTQAILLAVGTCTITADQAGDAQYQPAPQVQVSFGVVLAPQTIHFVSPGERELAAGAFAATATASSGLAVTLFSQTPATCSVSGLNVTPLALGLCTLRAEQAGSAVYAAALAVTQSFNIVSTENSVADADVPLPPWAVGLLSLGLAGGLWRRSAAARRT